MLRTPPGHPVMLRGARSGYDGNMTEPFAAHYLEEIRRQLRGHKRMAEGAIGQLKDEDLLTAIDPESNSVAILIKHIAGNMRSRFTDFLTTDGEKPDRHRDQEFELTSATTRADLTKWWAGGLGR